MGSRPPRSWRRRRWTRPRAPAVRLRDVTVRFTTERGAVTALDRVSMNVAQGGFPSLSLGPSGCGKSTLLAKVVSDLIPATSGEVEVMGVVGGVGEGGARHRLRIPGRFAARLADRARKRRIATRSRARRWARRRAQSARAASSRWSASPAGRRPIRTNCRAVCASAWRSPARLSTIRSFC